MKIYIQSKGSKNKINNGIKLMLLTYATRVEVSRETDTGKYYSNEVHQTHKREGLKMKL